MRYQEAVGSFAELRTKPNAKGLDAFDKAKEKDPTLNEHLRVHKPGIDEATFDCKCGKQMQRQRSRRLLVRQRRDAVRSMGLPAQPGIERRIQSGACLPILSARRSIRRADGSIR